MLKCVKATSPFNASASEAFLKIRDRRLMQICGISLLGLLISASIANGITFWIFVAGILALLSALTLVFKGRGLASAYVLLWSMAIMLSMFSLTGAGLFDIAMLAYPVVLIMATMLGNLRLLSYLFLFIVIHCIFIVVLTLQAYIAPSTPSLSWQHLVFILVIFFITGFTVYILVCDLRDLMLSLHTENAKVQKSKETIEHLAHHDALTDLPNRLYGQKLFKQLMASCKSQNQTLALMFIDLDNFKPVNDALGHSAGDELLKRLANRLSELLPEKSQLIRFGGDEFLALVPLASNKIEINNLAEGVMQHITSAFQIHGTEVSVSGSIGIACAPRDGSDFNQLCQKADIAMYQAKGDGRNTYCLYRSSLDQKRRDKFELLQKLRHAVQEQQFVLYYQPMIDLSTRQVSAVEALARWPQADGSMIGPDQFIPLAETSGLINKLGAWVIQEACRQCAQWRAQGFSSLRVAVNVSAVQFRDEMLQTTVEEALQASGLPANALELELTESLLIEQPEHVQEQLNALTQLGLNIAIDDFGTGYSNLSYLNRFNASTLKIDRSFITTDEQFQANAMLVKAIIQMAKSLHLKTVAEGIESQQIARYLAELGCNKGQGFFWSPAVPAGKLLDLINKLQA